MCADAVGFGKGGVDQVPLGDDAGVDEGDDFAGRTVVAVGDDGYRGRGTGTGVHRVDRDLVRSQPSHSASCRRSSLRHCCRGWRQGCPGC